MRNFPPRWATDLAILQHSGSTVENRDHLVIRVSATFPFARGFGSADEIEQGLRDLIRQQTAPFDRAGITAGVSS